MPVLPLSADDGPGLLGQGRVPDRLGPVGLGVLTGEISPGMVDEVIGLAGCREKRRRLLPARTVVFWLGCGQDRHPRSLNVKRRW